MMDMRFLCKTKQYGITTAFFVVVMLLLLSPSCTQENKEVVDVTFDPETTFTLRATDVASLISDSGVTRYRLNAKEWLVYDKAAEPNWYFPEGIYVEKFDSLFNAEANIKADTAYFWTKKELWRLVGNVHVENLQGEVYDGPELYWDQKKKRIYSDKPAHIIRSGGKEIFSVNGFEADQDMTDYKFYNSSMDLGEFNMSSTPDNITLADTVKIVNP